MGFFQGVARAYGEISERKEREGVRKDEREYDERIRKEDREFRREELLTQMTEKRRDQLFTLSAARAQASGSAGEYANAPVALSTYLGDLAETPEGKSLLIQARDNPKAAKMILDQINSSDRKIGASEVLQYQIVGSSSNPGIITDVDYASVDVSDRDAYEEAFRKLQLPSTQSPEIIVPDSVKNEYSPQDITFAAEQFEKAVESAAFDSISGMSEEEQQNSDVAGLLDQKKNGDPLATLKLNKLFGAQAALSLQGNDYITALRFVPEVADFVETNEVVLRLLNDPELSDLKRAEILERFPHFQGYE